MENGTCSRHGFNKHFKHKLDDLLRLIERERASESERRVDGDVDRYRVRAGEVERCWATRRIRNELLIRRQRRVARCTLRQSV